MLHQRLLRASLLLPLVGGMLILLFSAVPSRTAFACLPCNCPDHRSVNCFGAYALYTPTEEDGSCAIDIWVIQPDGQGKRTLMVTSDELAELPDAEDIDGYVLVDDGLEGFIALYKLQTDRYQINVGPNAEAKVHTIDFIGCPADDVHEGTFIVGQ